MFVCKSWCFLILAHICCLFKPHLLLVTVKIREPEAKLQVNTLLAQGLALWSVCVTDARALESWETQSLPIHSICMTRVGDCN